MIKKTLISFFSIAIILLQVQTITAQQRQNNAPPIPDLEQIDKMILDLKSKLELTDYQAEVIKKMYIVHFDQVKEKQNEKNPDKKIHREEMEKLRNDFHSKVKSELSKEQQVKYDDFLKNKPGRGEGQRPGGKKGKRGRR